MKRALSLNEATHTNKKQTKTNTKQKKKKNTKKRLRAATCLSQSHEGSGPLLARQCQGFKTRLLVEGVENDDGREELEQAENGTQ